jgi:hypothetical protein
MMRIDMGFTPKTYASGAELSSEGPWGTTPGTEGLDYSVLG